MAMKVSLEEFLGTEEDYSLCPEVVAEKMLLDFEADVFFCLKNKGLKKKDLAELLGVSAATVSKMLAEGSNLTLKSIARIASALDCSVSSPRLQPLGAVNYDYSNMSSASVSEMVSMPERIRFPQTDFRQTSSCSIAHLEQSSATNRPAVRKIGVAA